ncbi:MAG: HEAT repeat domain-containing protein, partial [Planctomycetaceae bacterium]
MRVPSHCLLATSLGCLLAPVAHADVVHLRGGGQVEGTVKRVAAERAPYAVVQIDAGLSVLIPESQIARVADSTDLEEYRQRAKATSESAEEHYELARWCKGNQLHPQSRHHYQRAIAIDPEHAKSRAALGYVKYENRWIRDSELRKIRGMISVAGRDRLPEEVALRDALDETNVEMKRWNREIARLRAAVLRGGEKGAEAQAKLAAIEDPNASPAIAG